MSRHSIPDITCGHCKQTVQTVLEVQEGQARIDVDLETREIDLEISATVEQILAALKAAGYEATKL